MNLKELLQLKALELKRTAEGQNDISDRLIEDILAKSPGSEYRNICAHCSVQLADEIDNICGLLGLSKRRFIEGALIEAVKLAQAAIAEVKPFELEA